MTSAPRTIADAIDRMLDEQEQRHAWLTKAAEQIAQWRAEDAAAGIEWESTRERGGGNVAPVDR